MIAARTDKELAKVLKPALEAFEVARYETTKRIFPDLALSEAFQPRQLPDPVPAGWHGRLMPDRRPQGARRKDAAVAEAGAAPQLPRRPWPSRTASTGQGLTNRALRTAATPCPCPQAS